MKGNIISIGSFFKANNFSIPHKKSDGIFLTELGLKNHREFGYLHRIKIEDASSINLSMEDASFIDSVYMRMFGNKHSSTPLSNNDTMYLNVFIYAVQMKHNIFLNRDFNSTEVDRIFDLAYRYDDYYIDHVPYINDDLGYNKYGNIMILGVKMYMLSYLFDTGYIPVSTDIDLDMEFIYEDLIKHLRLDDSRKIFVLCDDDDNPYSEIFGSAKMFKFKDLSVFHQSNT